MKIHVSSIHFGKPEVTQSFLSEIAPQLRYHLDEFPEDSIRLTLTNNWPEKSGQNLNQHDVAALCENPRFDYEVECNAWNKGFGKSHNETYHLHPSDAFVLLNNDLFFREKDWLSKMLAPIIADEADLMGLANAPKQLFRNGHGNPHVTDSESFDYLDGAALAVRSETINKYGLFAEDLKVVYAEDSDLSLRYRQLNLRLGCVPIAHKHARSTSAKAFSDVVIDSLSDRNRARMLSRWTNYLTSRQLQNRILVNLQSDGWGDIVCALPTLLQLLEDHPAAKVVLLLSKPETQFLFDELPRIEVITENERMKSHLEESPSSFDRVFSLSRINYNSTIYLGRQIAATAGVEFQAEQAGKHLLAIASHHSCPHLKDCLESPKVAVIHPDLGRTDWEGRAVPSKAYLPLVEKLHAEGYRTALIGHERTGLSQELSTLCDFDLVGKTSLLDLCALIDHAALFLGSDSGPMHIAQYLGTKSFIVFGATLPTSRILNWNETGIWMNWDLDCLGCYHLLRKPVFNTCIRLDQACVKKIDEAKLQKAFAYFLSANTNNLAKALNEKMRVLAILEEINLRESEVRIAEKASSSQSKKSKNPIKSFTYFLSKHFGNGK